MGCTAKSLKAQQKRSNQPTWPSDTCTILQRRGKKNSPSFVFGLTTGKLASSFLDVRFWTPGSDAVPGRRAWYQGPIQTRREFLYKQRAMLDQVAEGRRLAVSWPFGISWRLADVTA